MADSSLTVTSGSGGNQSAATESTLQSAQSNQLNSAQGKDFQPGISGSSLNTATQGISLTPTALSTVDLSGSASTSTVAQAAPVKDHYFNPALMLVAIGLFIVSIAMFVIINRSGKKHNQYK